MPQRRSPASLRRLALSNIASYVDQYWLADPEWSQRNTHKDDFLDIIVPMFLQNLIDELVSSGCLKYHHLMSLMDRRIKKLNLSGALNLLDDADEVDSFLRLISTRCTNLTVLSLEDELVVELANLRQLVKSLPLLTHLNLRGTLADDEVVSLVGECCPNIVCLDLRGCPVSDAGIINMCVSNDENVRKCQKLVKIDLTDTQPAVTDSGVQALLANAPRIQYITGVDLCKAVYDLYGKIEEHPVPAEQQLQIRSIEHYESGALSDHYPELEVCVAHCPHITEVSLGFSINDACLPLLSHLPLTVLELINPMSSITFQGGLLPLLEQAGSELLELILLYIPVPDLGILATLCPKLKVLSIWLGFDASQPTDMTFPNLEKLILNFRSVRHPVPTEKFTVLKMCPNLRDLCLAIVDSPTDDLLRTIAEVSPLTSLTTLWLYKCLGVSEDGLRLFVESQNELGEILLMQCNLTPDECVGLKQYIRKHNYDTVIKDHV